MPFQKGNTYGKKGRPKGAAHKLSQSYVEALYRDFQRGGAATIERLREKQPDVYLRLVAALVPKTFSVEKAITHQFVINADPELTLNQWKRLHELQGEHIVKDIKSLEHVQ
jgi:hypothetical protein